MAGAILFSKIDEAGRFPDFVSELQSFFVAHGLPVGTSAAILQVADNIAGEGAFRDDLLSMLQVVCASEERISYLELLGLLLVAAAGRDEAEALGLMPHAEEPVRGIFQLVVQARRPATDEPETSVAAETEGASLVEPEESAGAIEIPENRFTPSAPLAEPRALGRSEPRTSMLARALAISADEETFAPEPARTPKPPARAVAPVEIPVPTFGSDILAGSPPRRLPVWAIGAGGVVLGLLLGLLLPRHNAGSAPSATAPATANQAVAGTTPARVGGSPSREPVSRPWGSGETVGRATPRNAEIASREESSGVGAPSAAAAGRRSGRSASSDIREPGSAAASGNATNATPAGTKSSASRFGPAVPRARSVDLSPATDAGSEQSSGALRTKLPSVVTGAAGIMAANLVSAPAPAYPPQASASKVQGEVVIEAVVGRDGTVIDTRVISGPELLRQAALSAVQKWQFRPYEVDGAPAEIATTARLQFRLNAE